MYTAQVWQSKAGLRSRWKVLCPEPENLPGEIYIKTKTMQKNHHLEDAKARFWIIMKMIGHRHHWNSKAWATALISFPCLSWLSKTSRTLRQEVTQASIHCEGAETQIRHIALSQRCCCWEVDLVFTCLHMSSLNPLQSTAETNSQATCGLERRRKQNWSNRRYQTKQLARNGSQHTGENKCYSVW